MEANGVACRSASPGLSEGDRGASRKPAARLFLIATPGNRCMIERAGCPERSTRLVQTGKASLLAMPVTRAEEPGPTTTALCRGGANLRSQRRRKRGCGM